MGRRRGRHQQTLPDFERSRETEFPQVESKSPPMPPRPRDSFSWIPNTNLQVRTVPTNVRFDYRTWSWVYDRVTEYYETSKFNRRKPIAEEDFNRRVESAEHSLKKMENVVNKKFAQWDEIDKKYPCDPPED